MQEKAADSIARRSDTVKWVMGPSGTIVTFPEELGLPSIFNSSPQRYRFIHTNIRYNVMFQSEVSLWFDAKDSLVTGLN